MSVLSLSSQTARHGGDERRDRLALLWLWNDCSLLELA